MDKDDSLCLASKYPVTTVYLVLGEDIDTALTLLMLPVASDSVVWLLPALILVVQKIIPIYRIPT